MRLNCIVTYGNGHDNFAHFSFPKTKNTFTNENTIVAPELKGQGVLNRLNDFMFKEHPDKVVLYSNTKKDGDLDRHHKADKNSEWKFIEFFSSGQSTMCRYAKDNPYKDKVDIF